MKNILLLLPFLVFILLFSSFDKRDMLGRPMPQLPNKTLDGRTIDENFYKGHVTIVSFMYIGCPPCMNEITTLNKIKNDYTNTKVQVLCVARQMRQQMIDFNTNDRVNYFNHLRKTMKTDSITYLIQPICNDAASKMQMSVNGTDTSYFIKSECDVPKEKFGVDAFPTIFYVDKKGIIRKIKVGASDVKNDQKLYDGIKKEIDLLLAE